MTHDTKQPIAIPPATLKELAATVAAELKAHAGDATVANTGGGSAHRGLPPLLRERFIDVRAALFQRGIYDPVLVRFDTATAPQASTQEVAEQLEQVAAAL
jgi:hypothetical protein